MIVCVCHRVSDRDIVSEVRHGCDSFGELQDELRVGTACGTCIDCARTTFEEARASCSAHAGASMPHGSHGIRVIPITPAQPQPLAA